VWVGGGWGGGGGGWVGGVGGCLVGGWGVWQTLASQESTGLELKDDPLFAGKKKSKGRDDWRPCRNQRRRFDVMTRFGVRRMDGEVDTESKSRGKSKTNQQTEMKSIYCYGVRA